MRAHNVLVQIRLVIGRLIEEGLSIQQNYPALRRGLANLEEIHISGMPDLSISMKDVPYGDIYKTLDAAGAYHVKMIDGALLQMCYRFVRGEISEHRLCVFPAPRLENFDVDPASYENDELYADIVGRSIVHVPMRFDFNSSGDKHVDMKHPKSHLTLGQYPNCRIPVNAPISPARFIKFVLRNFYNTAYEATGLVNIDSAFCFPETLTANERNLTHLAC